MFMSAFCFFFSFLTLYANKQVSKSEKILIFLCFSFFSFLFSLCWVVVNHSSSLSSKILLVVQLFISNIETTNSLLTIYQVECFFIAVFTLLFVESKVGQKIWNLYLFSVFNFIILHVSFLFSNFCAHFIFYSVVLSKMYSPLTFCIYVCVYEQVSFFTLLFFCCVYPILFFCILLQVKILSFSNSFICFFLFLQVFFSYYFIHNTKKMFLVVVFSSCANLSVFVLLIFINHQKTFFIFFIMYGFISFTVLCIGKSVAMWKMKKISFSFEYNAQNKNLVIFFCFSSFSSLPLSWNFFFKIFCLLQIYLCTNFSFVSVFLFLFFITTLLYFYMLINLQMSFQKKFLPQKTNFFVHWAVFFLTVLVGTDVIGFFVLAE